MIRTAFDIPRAASSAACLTPNLRPPFPGQRSDVLVAPDWGKGCGGGRGVGEFPFIFSLTQAQDDQEWGVEKGVGEERGGMVSWLLRKALRSQGDWSRRHVAPDHSLWWAAVPVHCDIPGLRPPNAQSSPPTQS